MNKTQKLPNNGFRIVWFMLLEAIVSLIVISIAATTNTFIAVFFLASMIGLFIKLTNITKPAKVVRSTNEYSFAPYTTIVDGWKSLFMPAYDIISNGVRTISKIHPHTQMPAIKHQEPAIKTFVSA